MIIIKGALHLFLAPALPVAFICWVCVVAYIKTDQPSDELVNEVTNEINQMYPMWSRVITSVLFYTALIYLI